MRTVWPKFLLVAVLLTASYCRAESQYKVSASLNDSSHTIVGHLSTVITDLSPAWQKLHFRLYPNRFCDSAAWADGTCGLVIDSLFVNGANRIGEAHIGRTDLWVPISYGNLTDKELTIESYFTLKMPPDRERFGYADGQYALEAWLPVLAPRDDSGWIVVDYSNPTVEPVGDAASFDLTLSVPEPLKVIAPGITDSSRSDSIATYQIHMENAAHVAVIVAADYATDTKTTGDISHTVYFRPEAANTVDSIQQWIAYTLQFMSEHVYPFPKKELDLVVGGLTRGGGLEHPQMIWISDPAPASPFYAPRMVVVHEVIHEWFFYMVNSNQADSPWLDESVTEYFTLRVLRALTGGIAINYYGMTASYELQHRVSADRLFAFDRIDQPARDVSESELFSTIYAKGAELMTTLTGQMGENEDAFWHEYVAVHLFQRPTPDSFYDLAESFARGNKTGRVQTLLTTLEKPDYRVESIENQPPAELADSLADSTTTFESTVRLSVANAIPFPVELRLIFDDASSRDTTMSLSTGKYKLVRHDERKVIGAIVDPAMRISIDDNFLNNSHYLDSVNSADQRILSVLTYLVESLYSILWGM